MTVDFMSAAPKPMAGNTPTAARYAAELRHIVTTHAEQAPRSVQKHLGPSELGSLCDRQVAGKMAGHRKTNHVYDPWPSVKGTALHAWVADCFWAENRRTGILRYLPENRVTPHDLHPGTSDLYDAQYQAVVDHKFLGDSSLDKVRRPEGPPRKYQVQLLLYGLGFRRIGLPVDRVMVAAYPVNRSTLDGLYVWDHEWTPADDELLKEVFASTEHRRQTATRLAAGLITLNDIPMTPDDDECWFCPFYRPEAARDNGPGCPGTVSPK